MDILIVGAGAVGQAYARHMQKAGHQVSFLVKPKYKAACESGMVLYQLNGRTERQPLMLRVDAVLTNLDEVRSRAFDQVWVTIPADALTEAWLSPFAAAIGSATFVSMTPGMEVQAAVRRALPEEQLVFGQIGVVSFQAPLPGDTLAPGIAYITSALSPNLFGGKHARTAADALALGGCPSRVVANIDASLARGSAFLMPQVLALEMSGWSLARHRKETLALATDAGKEARIAVERKLGLAPSFASKLLTPFTLDLAWLFAPSFVPFDLEVYLRVHFSKVRAQSVLLLQGYRQTAEALGLGHANLDRLLAFTRA
jgi:ketopantoate reductase